MDVFMACFKICNVKWYSFIAYQYLVFSLTCRVISVQSIHYQNLFINFIRLFNVGLCNVEFVWHRKSRRGAIFVVLQL